MNAGRLEQIVGERKALMEQRGELDPRDPVHKVRLEQIDVTLEGLGREELTLLDLDQS